MAGLHVLYKWTLGQVNPAHNMARPRTELSQDLLGLDNLHSKPKIQNMDLDTDSLLSQRALMGHNPTTMVRTRGSTVSIISGFLMCPEGPRSLEV